MQPHHPERGPSGVRRPPRKRRWSGKKGECVRRTGLVAATMAVALLLSTGVALAAAISGTQGNDTLRGTRRADQIYGLNGRDTLKGFAGGDELYGGAGLDRLVGSGGNDEI